MIPSPRFACRLSVLMVSVFAAAAPAASVPDPGDRRPREPLEQAGARVDWRVALPLAFVDRIEDYQLVEGVIYATGTDGLIRAIDAATGIYRWTARIGRGSEPIWGPSPYHEAGMNAVVFTTTREAVFLDQRSGDTIQRTRLFSPAAAAVVAFDEWLFCPSVGGRVWCVRIKDGSTLWQIGSRGPIQIAPIYIPDEDLLVIVDDAGFIHGSDSDRHRHFTIDLEGEPRGWITSDQNAIYVTTAGKVPAVHAQNRATGKALREPYRLSARPEGGPVVTHASLYQSIADGGVHRLGFAAGSRRWFNPHARGFLAEWPGSGGASRFSEPARSVLLRLDGRIEFVETQTGVGLGMLDLGVRFRRAIFNTKNDLAIVATDRGEIWCLRPANAGPVDVASFQPTTQPATRPAQTRPAGGPSNVFSRARPGGTLAPRGGSGPPTAPQFGNVADPAVAPLPPGAPLGGVAPAGPAPAGAPREPRHSVRGRIADQLDEAGVQYGR